MTIPGRGARIWRCGDSRPPTLPPSGLWGHLGRQHMADATSVIGLPRSAHMPKRGQFPGDGLQAAALTSLRRLVDEAPSAFER